MSQHNRGPKTIDDGARLRIYIVDLEVEVDRLRQHNRIFQEEIRSLCRSAQLDSSADKALSQTAIREIMELLDEMQQMPEYHPADDEVTPIAMRPLVEQVFRYHQRWTKSGPVTLTMKLESEQIEWFPSRLRHIFDIVFSNSLKFCDSEKKEPRIVFELYTADPEWITLRLIDNGIGMNVTEVKKASDLHSRAESPQGTRPEVGLAVAKRLVEQSGGAFSIDSVAGIGTTVSIVLPRYQLDDFLT